MARTSPFSASLLSKIAVALVRDVDGDRLDRDDAEAAADSARDLGFRTDAVEIEISGYGDWIVTDDGDALAIERVTEDLENEPELFTSSWLADYYTVSPTDRRIYAQEAADHEAEGLTERDLEDEIDALLSVQAALASMEDAEADRDNYEAEAGDDYDDGEYEALDTAADEAYEAYEEAKEAGLDEARETWAANRAEEIEYDLKRDAPGYFRDLYGRDWQSIAGNLLILDVEKAAEDAVATDGAAHFLSSYDGNVTEIRVNGRYFYCYRTN
jgi:hypothetical protein